MGPGAFFVHTRATNMSVPRPSSDQRYHFFDTWDRFFNQTFNVNTRFYIFTDK